MTYKKYNIIIFWAQQENGFHQVIKTQDFFHTMAKLNTLLCYHTLEE